MVLISLEKPEKGLGCWEDKTLFNYSGWNFKLVGILPSKRENNNSDQYLIHSNCFLVDNP
jgi:hypothetical protein